METYYPANVQQPPRKKSRWWIVILIILGLFFFGLLALIVGFFALIRGSFQSKPVEVKPRTVLQMHVTGTLQEHAATNPLTIFSSGDGRATTLLDVLNALKTAKEDQNIIGLYYRSGDLSCGFAKAMELRDAIEDFKASGKPIYAFLEMGGELDYLFASAADSIYMPTEGLVELNGFAFEDIFWQGTFDKLGIRFHVQQFEEYKSAGESYVRKNFSPYARESLRALLDQYFNLYVDAIAKGRNQPPADMRSAIRRGQYTADSLLDLHFIDRITSESNVKDFILHRKIANDTSTKEIENNMMTLGQYIQSAAGKSSQSSVVRDKQIALISASGIIMPGEMENVPALSEAMVASNTFNKYMRQAREDKRIKAVIIRIDSPGGSVLAADAMWEEIEKTRKEKPVYASMSDVAASGGYYIAMPCDTIIAHPATLTGSIGVISMIPNFSGTLDKIGATVDTVVTSPSALFLDPLQPLNDRDKRKLLHLSAGAYERFVNRVALSRNKTFEQARSVARGRVWTGEAAFRNGLVDTLGGLQTALNIAKRRIGVAANQKVRLRILPPPQDPIDAFLKLFQQLSEDKTSSRVEAMAATVPGWPLLPETVQKQFIYFFQLNTLARREYTLMALPWLPQLN